MRNFSRGAILFLSAAAFLFFGDEALRAQSFSSMHYRDLGPYRGGRVTTVAGIASQPGTYYLGATGGRHLEDHRLRHLLEERLRRLFEHALHWRHSGFSTEPRPGLRGHRNRRFAQQRH